MWNSSALPFVWEDGVSPIVSRCLVHDCVQTAYIEQKAAYFFATMFSVNCKYDLAPFSFANEMKAFQEDLKFLSYILYS